MLATALVWLHTPLGKFSAFTPYIDDQDCILPKPQPMLSLNLRKHLPSNSQARISTLQRQSFSFSNTNWPLIQAFLFQLIYIISILCTSKRSPSLHPQASAFWQSDLSFYAPECTSSVIYIWQARKKVMVLQLISSLNQPYFLSFSLSSSPLHQICTSVYGFLYFHIRFSLKLSFKLGQRELRKKTLQLI